jgi:hypothetical protein
MNEKKFEELFKCALSGDKEAIALVEKEIWQKPFTYADKAERLYYLGRQKGYNPKMFELLPKIVMAYRRMHYFVLKNYPQKPLRAIVIRKHGTEECCDLIRDIRQYTIRRMCCDLEGLVCRIYDLQYQSGNLDPLDYVDDDGYKKYLRDHAGNCPFPPI